MIESEVELRRKRQLTWPEDIAAAMGVGEGAHLVIEYDPETQNAVVRRTRATYAGALRGAYGQTERDMGEYIDRERASWIEAE